MHPELENIGYISVIYSLTFKDCELLYVMYTGVVTSALNLIIHYQHRNRIVEIQYD